MAERIEIVLTGKDEATSAFKKVVGANNDLQQSVKKTSFSFTELNSIVSIAQQGLAQLKKGYDFAKEGASIEFTQVKFERLAATIGTTADVLLNDLKTATRGTYSDMELMASAADLVGLGLANSHDEAVRLAAVSSGLNMDMNQLVLTLTNMTDMRFDQLNVRVDGFWERVEKLKKAGMDANAAFKEAFLQQAEEQLLKVGNAADENIGTFMKLESTWKNFTDSLKMGAAEGLAPTIEGINDSIEAANNYYDVLDAVAAANGITTRELRKMREEQDYLVNSYVRAEQYGAAWGAILEENIEKIDTATDKAISFKDQMSMMGDLIKGDLGNAQDEYNAKMAEYNKQLDAAKTQKEKDKINENIAAETSEYEKRATAIMFNIQQEAILNSTTLNDSQKIEMIGTLAQSYGMLDQATVDAMMSTQDIIAQVEAGNMTWDTAQRYLRGTTKATIDTGKALDAVSEPVMHTGTLAENSAKKFADFKNSQQEMAQGLDSEATPAIAGVKSVWQGLMGLPSELDFTVNVHTNGSFPNIPSAQFDDSGKLKKCFLAGTLITMADGTRKPIENIEVGDTVRSYNFAGGEFVAGKVAATMSRGAGVYLQIDGIKVTREHPFWTPDGWVKSGDLKAGDMLFTDIAGEKPIREIITTVGDVIVYNIEVEGVHNYFAGGVLVHNKAVSPAMGGLIQGFPMGGIVTGRGTSTSDSVPAWLSRGEYVVRAAAVQRIGAHNLERMEAGGGATGSGMYVHIDNLNVTGDGSLREELMRAVPYQV